MKNFCLLLACLCVCSVFSCYAQSIMPGKEWKDTDGNPINAHGGGVLYHDGTYYWYGEYRVSIHIALPVLIGIVTGPKLAVSHVILRKIYIIGNSKALYWNRIHLILIPTSIHPWL